MKPNLPLIQTSETYECDRQTIAIFPSSDRFLVKWVKCDRLFLFSGVNAIAYSGSRIT
ncbi:MAG TPA: hypothetical protein V6D30_11825 [Leptolyngbyaceae cyanobacterium]